MSRSRVGVLGGTFDPVHNGHLAIAQLVRRELDLTEVLLVPAPRPWMKDGKVDARAQDRLAMIDLAIAGHPGLRSSRVDIDRPGPTYSIDTIRDLKRQLGSDADIHFIVGADTLKEMVDWRDDDRIFEECTVVAVARPGHPHPEQLPAEHPGRSALFVGGPLVDVSASDVRRRVRRGEPIGEMVPSEVALFIRERGLYRAAGE